MSMSVLLPSNGCSDLMNWRRSVSTGWRVLPLKLFVYIWSIISLLLHICSKYFVCFPNWQLRDAASEKYVMLRRFHQNTNNSLCWFRFHFSSSAAIIKEEIPREWLFPQSAYWHSYICQEKQLQRCLGETAALTPFQYLARMCLTSPSEVVWTIGSFHIVTRSTHEV